MHRQGVTLTLVAESRVSRPAHHTLTPASPWTPTATRGPSPLPRLQGQNTTPRTPAPPFPAAQVTWLEPHVLSSFRGPSASRISRHMSTRSQTCTATWSGTPHRNARLCWRASDRRSRASTCRPQCPSPGEPRQPHRRTWRGSRPPGRQWPYFCNIALIPPPPSWREKERKTMIDSLDEKAMQSNIRSYLFSYVFLLFLHCTLLGFFFVQYM